MKFLEHDSTNKPQSPEAETLRGGRGMVILYLQHHFKQKRLVVLILDMLTLLTGNQGVQKMLKLLGVKY